MPSSMLQKITMNFPDIDRLEGYSTKMKCEPPGDYLDAYAKNYQNMGVVAAFISDYLLEHRGVDLLEPMDMDWDVSKDFYTNPKERDPTLEELDEWDPTEDVLDAAYKAVLSGSPAPLRSQLTRMEAMNGTGVNCRNTDTLQTPLHFAAVAGQSDVVELLVAAGADVHATCIDGETAICKAAESGRRGVVRALLRLGAHVDVPREIDGATPLHMAALVGHSDVCQLLLRSGADVEARTPKGQSPLHFAAMTGHWSTGVVEELLRHGADIDGQDFEGQTPLMMAIYGNSINMTKLLIRLGADIHRRDVNGDTALHHAMHLGIERHVITLLEHGADAWAKNKFRERAMDCIALWKNHHRRKATGEITYTGRQQKKLNAILLPYRYWWWPVFWIGPYRRGDWKRFLLSIDDRVKAWMARSVVGLKYYFQENYHSYFSELFPQPAWYKNKLTLFTQKRQLELEEYYDRKATVGGDPYGDVWLYDMGTEPYERMKSYSELQRAVVTGQIEIVRQLLQAGVNPWAQQGGFYSTVLIPSINIRWQKKRYRGHVRDQGATVDIEVRDHHGATPLIMAAALNDVRITKVLGEFGANLEAVDNFGWTALKRAAAGGKLEMVTLLLQLGAKPDHAVEFDGGRTALMLACASGHKAIILELLREGANLDQEDLSGRTPLNYATAAGMKEVAEWLRGRGAVMRIEGILQGFEPAFEPEERVDYSPLDRPKSDKRNPRYTGSYGS